MLYYLNVQVIIFKIVGHDLTKFWLLYQNVQPVYRLNNSISFVQLLDFAKTNKTLVMFDRFSET